MKNICVLFIGNQNIFKDTSQYHINFLNYYKKFFSVNIFCIIDNKSDTQLIQEILQPCDIISTDTFTKEIQDTIDFLINHPQYKKNLNIMNNYESFMISKREHSTITEQQIKQFFLLKKGIEMIEKYELLHNIIYDIFICTKYEFVLENFCDLTCLDKKDLTFRDVITCCNDKNLDVFLKTLDHYKINDDFQYLKYLNDIKLDRYAGCLYTDNLCNLNFGGYYIKNYDTLQKIYDTIAKKQQLYNLVYFYEDHAFFTQRKNMNKFKYLIASFGQHKFDDSYGTNIFTSSYQIMSYCFKNDLLPLMYTDKLHGGIFKKNTDVMYNYFIPNDKKLLIRNKNCEKINGMYTFNDIPAFSFKHVIPYGYFGEPLKISFTLETSVVLNLIIAFSDTSSKVFYEETFSINNGLFSFDTTVKTNDKFFILFEFTGTNNTLVKISDINIAHNEICLHYITFITEGNLYENAYDLSECDEILKQLTDKYADKYFCFKYRDLDNINEKKYITVAKTDKKQVNGCNINSEKIAFFKWKPYIIYKYLLQLPENHIMIYRDGNMKKYKQYFNSFDTIKHECTKILSTIPQKIWFLHENMGIKSIFHQKRYLNKEFNLIENEFFLNHDLINAATVICQKTDWTVNFMKKWVDGCLNDNFVNHEFIDNEHFLYKWHCNDQSVLNSIIIKMKQNNELDILYPYYINYDRELTFTKCDDLRQPKNYDGFLLNKIHLIGDVPCYSHGCKLVRNKDFSLTFTRSFETSYIPFQWIGYEVINHGKYHISFDIRFKNMIPDSSAEKFIGFKTHFPEKFYNDWLQKCELNKWSHVDIISDKPTDDIDLYILIFDNSKPLLEFDLQNYIFEKIN